MACPYALAPGPRKNGDVRTKYRCAGECQGPLVLQGRNGRCESRLHGVHHDMGIVGRAHSGLSDGPEKGQSRRRAGSHSNGHARDGLYLTVPGDIRRAIVKWAYQYLKDGAVPFPFVGDMGSDSYRFTIDFQRDTALKENVNIHADMGAYNAAHNAEKAARRTMKRFADLTGDRWTTAELHAQGFSDRNIKTFCKDGLIRKRYQRHYERNSK